MRGAGTDEKCDVFSFGVMLWECVTGRVPWDWMTNHMQAGLGLAPDLAPCIWWISVRTLTLPDLIQARTRKRPKLSKNTPETPEIPPHPAAGPNCRTGSGRHPTPNPSPACSRGRALLVTVYIITPRYDLKPLHALGSTLGRRRGLIEAHHVKRLGAR